MVSLEIIYHNCFPSVKQPSGPGGDIILDLPGDGTWLVGEGTTSQNRLVDRREAQGKTRSNLLIVSNPLHPIQMLVDCIVHPQVTGDQRLTRRPSQGEVGRIIGGTVEAYG